MDCIFDTEGQIEPGILDARGPVQNMHAETGRCNGHKVVSECALAFHLHALRICGVEKAVGEALDLVAADDFGATAFKKIDERLVAMCRNLAFDVDLYEERETPVARGAEPNLS